MDEQTLRRAVPEVRALLDLLDTAHRPLIDDEIVSALRTRGRALLDALDAVPRGQAGNDDYAAFHWMRRSERVERERDQERTRAERAERERDVARKERGRLLRFVSDVAAEEPGNVAEQFRTIRRLAQNIVSYLSADADADAEPSRAEGDDGRSRAIEAATKALQHWRVTLIDRPSNYARCAIDAALASGGVVTAERSDEAYRQGREHEAYDWHAIEDEAARLRKQSQRNWDLMLHANGDRKHLESRVRKLEAALREAVNAFEEIDRCAWLLHSAIGNGDTDYIDAAVEQYERSQDEMCMGPDAPMSRARAALEASDG